ncbi:MAG: glycosyltransferase [Phycisphaerae bacterium]|nr:glycosyltransferase [Phycisphaerae bacterium]
MHLPDSNSEQGDQARDGRLVDQPTIDVIVCVHNALDYVKSCLESVARNTPWDRARLLIVNDGSDEPTSRYLREFQTSHDFATLIPSTEAEGYTKAANKGLRASAADYVVLLNSDSVVPPRWVDRLIECGQSDARIGVLGPLSNAASYQSIPDIRSSKGEWAVNPLPEGVNVDDLAAKVHELSDRAFPRVPFINGFCYVIKRAVIDAIGLFDEETFPMGFGEENDYSIRARHAGFELAIADHGYVYHAKSKSFGPERRRQLARTARQALERKHGPEKVQAGVNMLEANHRLEKLRQSVRDHLEVRESQNLLPEVRGMKILYLLRGRGGGGGVHSIYQEASGMRRFSVHTEIALPRKVEESYRASYPSAPEGLFWYFDDEADLWRHAETFDVVVATIFTTVRPLEKLYERVPTIVPAYYIQDYEPWIIRDPTPELVREAEESYTAIPDMLCFAKTDWIRETVRKKHGTFVHKVSPSLDTSVYYPDRIKKKKGGPVDVVAMVRPTTPRRAPRETMEILRAVQQKYPDLVRVTVFGNDPESAEFKAMPRDFEFVNRGILVREEVAELMGAADVFVDFSVYQAFGRTGLEAMAVGCATILPKEGGVYEYAVHRENALIVDTSDRQECIAALTELVTDVDLRSKLKWNGLETASRFSIRSAVISELKVFSEAVKKKRA